MRAHVVVSVVALAAPWLAATPARAVVDHFTCYRSRTATGTPKFTPHPGVHVVDRFGARTFIAFAHERLCTPTDKAGEDPTAPLHPDHLAGYQIRKEVPHFSRVHGLVVSNQFGTVTVDTTRPNRLLVPTAKSLSGPPPGGPSPALDHFTCFKLKPSAGAPAFVRVVGVGLADQLGGLTVDVRKPRMLCTPANKNDESPGAETHPDYLLCYAIKLSAGSAPFATRTPVFVTNQFGPATLTVHQPAELCVPSSVAP